MFSLRKKLINFCIWTGLMSETDIFWRLYWDCKINKPKLVWYLIYYTKNEKEWQINNLDLVKQEIELNVLEQYGMGKNLW